MSFDYCFNKSKSNSKGGMYLKKNRIFKSFIVLCSLLVVITTTFQPTLAFITTKTQPITNTFIPFKSIISNLIINKSVEHPFGSDYAIPGNIKFDFEVNLGANYAGRTLTTTNGDIIADANGSLIVTAKPGIPVEINGIDEGTKAIVTELQTVDNGFAVKDGIATKEVIVAGDSSVSVDFVNVYTPATVQPVNVNVTGTKFIQGRDWQNEDTFSFLLEQITEDNQWTSLASKTITYNPDTNNFNKFDFNDVIQNLEFTKAGVYSFRLSEISGNIDNLTYDKAVNYFDITVGDKDMDGKLEIQNVTASENATATLDSETGIYTVEAIFNNLYIPPDTPKPEDINIPVTVIKTITNTGNGTIGPENFEFVLQSANTDESQLAKSDENGLAEFNLAFTADDIGKSFSYKLYEKNTGIKDVTYSDVVYDVQISISLGIDGKLLPTIRCNGDIVSEITAEFENIYQGKADIPDKPTDEPTKPTAPTVPTKPTEPTKPTAPADTGNTPTNPDTTQDKDVLQTGDTRNIIPLLALLVISGTVWITLVAKAKKTNNK